jgi:hypothetical protein
VIQLHRIRSGIITCAVVFAMVLVGHTRATAQTPPPDYLQPLLRALMDAEGEDFYTAFGRASARNASGQYNTRDQGYILIALSQRARQSAEYRPEILTLLGQIGRPESVPVLMEYAAEGTGLDRISALQALGWMGDEESLGVVESVDTDGSDSTLTAMVDYASKVIRLKRRIRQMGVTSTEASALIRKVLLEESNWLVRSDIARYISHMPGEEVWDIIFDARTRWNGPPQFEYRLSIVLTQRYRYDPKGFMPALRSRDTDDHLFGLRAIVDDAATEHMADLMEMAETHAEKVVRQAASSALSNLIHR